MTSSLLRRPICINCRITASPFLPFQSCRTISARSAINKGLRTTRDEGRGERGGRDGVSRPQSSRSDSFAPRRASLSERVERTDRDWSRRDSPTSAKFDSDRSRFGGARPREREEKTSFRQKEDFGPPRRGGFGEGGGKRYFSRSEDDSKPQRRSDFGGNSGPPRRGGFGERGGKSFSSRRDESGPSRLGRFGERGEQSYFSRSRDDAGPPRRGNFGDRGEKGFSSRSRDDSGPPRRGGFGERGGKTFSSRSRDDSGPPRRGDFGERSGKDFSSNRRDDSGPSRRSSYGERDKKGFPLRSGDDAEPPSRSSPDGHRRESWFSRPNDDSGPSRSGSVGGPSEKGSPSRPRYSAEADLQADRGAEVSAREHSEQINNPPKIGLLREIKTACKLVKTIQERQVTGEGIDGLKSDAISCLNLINSFVKSGVFKFDEPSEAIADLLRKKAANGTFTKELRGDSATVIFQKEDGTLALAIGRGGSVRPSKSQPSREPDEDVGERRKSDRTQHRNEKFDKAPVKYNPRQSRNQDRDDEDDDSVPVSIPYTTAASEFLYGYNSVLAALRAQRRKIYKLYIHPKIFESEFGRGSAGRGSQEMPGHEFVSLAKAANIPFQNVESTRMLDNMSKKRPHNGLVLEVSKLPAPPVVSLGKADMKKAIIPLTLGRQTAEEAAVNGTPASIPLVAKSWRYPLVVLLDGIVDPGNVGNILRTCHFYGVDAVAVAVNTCSNLSSAVLAKASSGACEVAPILAISQPSNFIFESSKFRWKVFAAVAPTSGPSEGTSTLTTAALSADSPLAKHPCILMLGAEGEGLRENLKNRADHFISIAGGRRAEDTVDVGVDSMNVSTAAGVLLEAFLRKPEAAPEVLEAASELGF